MKIEGEFLSNDNNFGPMQNMVGQFDETNGQTDGARRYLKYFYVLSITLWCLKRDMGLSFGILTPI